MGIVTLVFAARTVWDCGRSERDHLTIVTVIAVISAAFATAMLSAVAGFGGAILLLPVFVAVFGIRDAIPILTVAQLVSNGSRVWFNRTEIVLPIVGWFALGAVPLAIVGGVLFATAPLSGLTRLLGVFLLLLVAWRRFRPAPSAPTLRPFTLIGAASGFGSALLGVLARSPAVVAASSATLNGPEQNHPRSSTEAGCAV